MDGKNRFIGINDAFRGYFTGRYRDKVSLTVQAEYRWQFFKRWSAVAFGGVAEVARDFDQFSTDNLLPALGVGVRWMAAEKNRINVRLDYAVGKDDGYFYLSVGEAF